MTDMINEFTTITKVELAALRARVAELEQSQAWISVDQRLPMPEPDITGRHEPNARYLVCAWMYNYKRKVVFSATYWFHLHEWSGDGASLSRYVTHWRPLPSPPV